MKTLIVAFDGLDYELIKKYNCKNIKQEEFGKIDNYTGIKEIKTSEEFASFITGKTWEEHSIEGYKRINNPYLDKLRKFLVSVHSKLQVLVDPLVEASSTFRHLDIYKRLYKKEDLDCISLFEEIKNSKALFVPSYNPSFAYNMWAKIRGIREREEFADMEFRRRKERLFDELAEEYKLLMCHFHKPDAYHHLYWVIKKENKVRKMYKEMDKLAGKIKNKAKDKYRYIIFMSDHGLPVKKEHNKNAFYSCNRELFPDKTPHITDFHDKILNES